MSVHLVKLFWCNELESVLLVLPRKSIIYYIFYKIASRIHFHIQKNVSIWYGKDFLVCKSAYHETCQPDFNPVVFIKEEEEENQFVLGCPHLLYGTCKSMLTRIIHMCTYNEIKNKQPFKSASFE